MDDLRKIFQVLSSINMRLNPTKCTFGVSSGKFLGYVVSKRGIEANPEKVKAVQDMNPPTSVKDV